MKKHLSKHMYTEDRQIDRSIEGYVHSWGSFAILMISRDIITPSLLYSIVCVQACSLLATMDNSTSNICIKYLSCIVYLCIKHLSFCLSINELFPFVLYICKICIKYALSFVDVLLFFLDSHVWWPVNWAWLVTHVWFVVGFFLF